jgi:hypothetical protein
MVVFYGDLTQQYIKKVISKYKLENLVPPFAVCSTGSLHVTPLRDINL